MLRSRFRFWALFLFLIFLLLCILYVLLLQLVIYSPENTPTGIYNGLGFFIFLVTCVLIGEIRTKAIVLKIEGSAFTYSRFFGLTLGKTVRFHEIDGFKTSILSSKSGNYEYLYLIQNGKKIAKISQFYHRNYWELKNNISKQSKYLGFEKFNYFRELKDIFQ